ncbi:hypothetical protein Tco_1182955 [Tanacetum coccineum]
MLAKQNDPISKEKKINTTPINYIELNRLFEDFGKRFVSQQELFAEQAFRLQTSHPNTDQSDISPVKIETPRELPKTDAVWCYFDAFLTSVEPKNYKEGMLEPSWIDAMQEEIHEFERLQVWELVPCPNLVMLIKLKRIFKVKKDEYGGVLKNKA